MRDGIDAIQMEFGSKYRQNAVLEKTGRDAGRAVAGFHAAYLMGLDRK